MLIDFNRYFLHFLPVILLAAPVLVWVYLNARTERQWTIGMAIVAVVGIASTAILLASQIPQAPRHDWSAGRLLASVTWVGGYRLYSPLGEGPVLMQMYGPVSAILYLPAALASRPTPAILTGTFIDCAIYVAPAVWFLHGSVRGKAAAVYTACATSLFLVLTAFAMVLLEASSRVTIDAPGVGFATCAMAMLIGGDLLRPFRLGATCGIFVALSLWTKLTLAPILLALPLYFLLRTNWRDAMRFTVAMGIVVLAVTGIFVASFGMALLQQNILVPARQPWQWPGISHTAAYLRAAGWIWYFSRTVGIILVIAILLRFDWPTFRTQNVKSFAAENPWLLPVLSSLCVIFTATLAYVKIGGAWNNAVAPSYFALLAAASAFGAACKAPQDGASIPRRHRIARLTFATLLLAITAIQWRSPQVIWNGVKVWTDLDNNAQEFAFHYAKNHPGEVYFPNQPLSSFLAEHRVYHFSAGIESLDWAGAPVSEEQLRAWLPQKMNRIAYVSGPAPNVLHHLPEFGQVREDAELPGWVVVTRSATEP